MSQQTALFNPSLMDGAGLALKWLMENGSGPMVQRPVTLTGVNHPLETDLLQKLTKYLESGLMFLILIPMVSPACRLVLFASMTPMPEVCRYTVL